MPKKRYRNTSIKNRLRDANELAPYVRTQIGELTGLEWSGNPIKIRDVKNTIKMVKQLEFYLNDVLENLRGN